jgi:hypothetical protein
MTINVFSSCLFVQAKDHLRVCRDTLAQPRARIAVPTISFASTRATQNCWLGVVFGTQLPDLIEHAWPYCYQVYHVAICV